MERSSPLIPLTTEELKEVLRIREDRDEREAIKELAQIGSTSAMIIVFLELTREVVKGGFCGVAGRTPAAGRVGENPWGGTVQSADEWKSIPRQAPKDLMLRGGFFLAYASAI